MLQEYVDGALSSPVELYSGGICQSCDAIWEDRPNGETCCEYEDYSYDPMDIRLTYDLRGHLYAVDFLVALGGPTIWVTVSANKIFAEGYWGFQHVTASRPLQYGADAVLDYWHEIAGITLKENL